MACPQAIDELGSLSDTSGMITLKGGQCRASNIKGCCQAVACAKKDTLKLRSSEITGRLWSVSSKCALVGSGGEVYGSRGLYVQLSRPDKAECNKRTKEITNEDTDNEDEHED